MLQDSETEKDVSHKNVVPSRESLNRLVKPQQEVKLLWKGGSK